MTDALPPLRALIIDDEHPARAELRYCLERQPAVEVLGEAATAREGLRLIEGLDYDVVFLDISMPGLSGLELADRLKGRPNAPAVVFVTAYDEFALKAYEVRGLDYLMKPVTDDRMAEALERVRRLMTGAGSGGEGNAAEAPTTANPPLPGAGGPRWVMAVRDDAAVPIAVEDIVFATSEGDQVYLYTETARHLTRQTLTELEQVLPSDCFLRCHRGYLVNLCRVREISPFFNGTYNLTVLHAGKAVTIPVSRNRVAEMKRYFWPK